MLKDSKMFISKFVTLITSAFGFVAALAWNEAIKSLIDTYVKKSSSNIISLFSYAALVTIVAVIITSNLSKLEKKANGILDKVGKKIEKTKD